MINLRSVELVVVTLPCVKWWPCIGRPNVDGTLLGKSWDILNIPLIGKSNVGDPFLCNLLRVGRPNIGSSLKYKKCEWTTLWECRLSIE